MHLDAITVEFQENFVFWQVIGVVASLIAIFAFITGISNLPELRRALRSRRRAERPRTVTRQTPAASRTATRQALTGYEVVFLPMRHIAAVAGAAAIASVLIAVFGPLTSALLPAPMWSPSVLIRSLWAGWFTLGAGHIISTFVLSHRRAIDRDTFWIFMLLPIFGGTLGVMAAVAALSSGQPAEAARLLFAFTTFMSAITFSFIVLAEVVAALFFVIEVLRH